MSKSILSTISSPVVGFIRGAVHTKDLVVETATSAMTSTAQSVSNAVSRVRDALPSQKTMAEYCLVGQQFIAHPIDTVSAILSTEPEEVLPNLAQVIDEIPAHMTEEDKDLAHELLNWAVEAQNPETETVPPEIIQSPAVAPVKKKRDVQIGAAFYLKVLIEFLRLLAFGGKDIQKLTLTSKIALATSITMDKLINLSDQ